MAGTKLKKLKDIYDPRAEREALAACLQGDTSEVLAWCKVDDFYDVGFMAAMRAVEELARNSEPVTFATVLDLLRRNGELTEGLEHSLDDVFDYKVGNAEAAAKLVREQANLRHLQELLRANLDAIESGRMRPVDVVSNIISDCVTINTGSGERSLHVSDVAARDDAHIRRIMSGDLVAHSVGFGGVDDAIGGILPSEYIGITGPPGGGKSLWKNMINQMAAKNGKPVLSYILEMTAEQEMRRSVAIHAAGAINIKRFRGGPNTEPPTREEFELYNRYKAEITGSDFPMHMCSSKFSLSELLSDAERRVQENGVEIVTIDYAQLIRNGDGSNRTGELERISAAWRMFALKHNVAVMMICRLNQSGAKTALTGGELTGAELYGSSSMQYDFSALCTIQFNKALWLCQCPANEQFTYNEDKEKYEPIHTQGVAKRCPKCGSRVAPADHRLGEINVLKARDGECFAKIPVRLSGPTLQMIEMSPDDLEREYGGEMDDPVPTSLAALEFEPMAEVELF